ncbi:syndecan-4 [Aplochiton taeniatus]
MLKVCLVLFLFSSVYSESARETETWMPMKTTQTSVVTTHDRLESSGDFGFTDGDLEDDYDDTDDEDDILIDDVEDEDDVADEDFSGSGAGAPTVTILNKNTTPSSQPNAADNKIPDQEGPFRPRPTADDLDLIKNSNEIPLRKAPPPQLDDNHPNVLMAHASDESIFNKTEVLAALIAGVAVGLLFAILLILLLIYRMKKKDEGSYDLGKKPIYKKAPTTEIYA